MWEISYFWATTVPSPYSPPAQFSSPTSIYYLLHLQGYSSFLHLLLKYGKWEEAASLVNISDVTLFSTNWVFSFEYSLIVNVLIPLRHCLRFPIVLFCSNLHKRLLITNLSFQRLEFIRAGQMKYWNLPRHFTFVNHNILCIYVSSVLLTMFGQTWPRRAPPGYV